MSTLLWETLRTWKNLGAFVSPHSPMQPAAPGCWAMTGDISLTHTPVDERRAQKMCISEWQKRYSVKERRHNRYRRGGDWSGLGWPCSMEVLVISDECTYGYRQPCSPVSLMAWSEVSICQGLRAYFTGTGWRSREKAEKRRENHSFNPSCPFGGRENLTWLTWTHLASLANRKCPLQLFFLFSLWRRGCPCILCNGQMLPTMFPFDFWPENKNWHYKCPMISSKLAWHSIAGPGGFLFVLCKRLCSCCPVPGLAIRMYWAFSRECGVLKRQSGRLERESWSPACVFKYLCSLS